MNGAVTKYKGSSTMGAGVVPVMGVHDFPGVTASIAATTLATMGSSTTPNAKVESLCNVIPYSGLGSVVARLAYTDNHSNTQSATSPSASGALQQQVLLYGTPKAGTNITVQSTVSGTLTYDMHCSAVFHAF